MEKGNGGVYFLMAILTVLVLIQFIRVEQSGLLELDFVKNAQCLETKGVSNTEAIKVAGGNFLIKKTTVTNCTKVGYTIEKDVNYVINTVTKSVPPERINNCETCDEEETEIEVKEADNVENKGNDKLYRDSNGGVWIEISDGSEWRIFAPGEWIEQRFPGEIDWYEKPVTEEDYSARCFRRCDTMQGCRFLSDNPDEDCWTYDDNWGGSEYPKTTGTSNRQCQNRCVEEGWIKNI